MYRPEVPRAGSCFNATKERSEPQSTGKISYGLHVLVWKEYPNSFVFLIGSSLKRRIEDLELRAGLKYSNGQRDDAQNNKSYLECDASFQKQTPLEKRHKALPKASEQSYTASIRSSVDQVPTTSASYNTSSTDQMPYQTSMEEPPLMWPMAQSLSDHTDFEGTPGERDGNILRTDQVLDMPWYNPGVQCKLFQSMTKLTRYLR